MFTAFFHIHAIYHELRIFRTFINAKFDERLPNFLFDRQIATNSTHLNITAGYLSVVQCFAGPIDEFVAIAVCNSDGLKRWLRKLDRIICTRRTISTDIEMEFFDLAYCKNYIVSEKEYSDHNQIKFLYMAECRSPSNPYRDPEPSKSNCLFAVIRKIAQIQLCQSSPLF